MWCNFKQLGIVPLLVIAVFNIILCSICLDLAVAFELGGKDTVILATQYRIVDDAN